MQLPLFSMELVHHKFQKTIDALQLQFTSDQNSEEVYVEKNHLLRFILNRLKNISVLTINLGTLNFIESFAIF